MRPNPCVRATPVRRPRPRALRPSAPARARQVAPELESVLGVLRVRSPRLLSDTAALVAGLERLTVTLAERWAALLGELEARTGAVRVSCGDARPASRSAGSPTRALHARAWQGVET